jgi:hypothetical protein
MSHPDFYGTAVLAGCTMSWPTYSSRLWRAFTTNVVSRRQITRCLPGVTAQAASVASSRMKSYNFRWYLA